MPGCLDPRSGQVIGLRETDGMTRACGLAGIVVIAMAFGGFATDFFTGSWAAAIGLAPQQTQPFTAFESTLDVGVHVGFLKMHSVSDFVIDGWVWEELGLLADVGFLSFDGHILYDPKTGSMVYAEGILGICFGPLTATLYGAETGATQSESANYGYVLDVLGHIGDAFSFESATYLGADLSGISFTASGATGDSTLLTKTFATDPTIDSVTAIFSGQDITIEGTFFDCITLASLTSFSSTGFEKEKITAAFHDLLGTPLTLTLDVIYQLQTASYVFTPSLETEFGCISVYSHILSTGSVMTGIELYGLKLAATIGTATIESISNFDTASCVITTPAFGSIVETLADAADAGHVYYDPTYWEVVRLTVGIPPISAGFSFSVETFFSTTDGLLFNWAKSVMGISLALGDSISTSTSISVDATGFTGWTLSFRVSW